MAKRDDITLDLFAPFGTPEAPSNPIEAKFWEFHRENPRVYRLFERFTREALRRRDRIAVSLIVERIRWETAVATTDEEFRLNNSFRAYYARLWMRDHPAHEGIFRTRRLQAGQESPALRRAAE